MKISFIIPAYNEEKYLGECLDSIRCEIKRAGADAEIIVVNNASTDRTAEIARSRPGVRVADEPQKGLTRARQRGLREAKGDFLAYLDADTRMPAGWLSRVFALFARYPCAVSVSGPYRYHDLPEPRRFFAALGWWVSAPLTHRVVGFMVLGGNFIAKRKALVAMGGFDTSIEFFGEDTNIAWRLSKQGTVIFRMNCFIYASGRRLRTEGLARSFFTYALNYLWMAIYHRPYTKHYSDIR
jgi:glycosyltransferase involved in cell wall biosynthesis